MYRRLKKALTVKRSAVIFASKSGKSASLVALPIWVINSGNRGEQFKGRPGPGGRPEESTTATLGLLRFVGLGVSVARRLSGSDYGLGGSLVEFEPILRHVLPFDDLGL
jgi:hypothetical protein